jgi:hypothetical protein
MFYTPDISSKQVNSNKRVNKKLDRVPLPVINPVFVSMTLASSHLIDEVEDIFNEITTATSYDGKEVTVSRRDGGRQWKPSGWTLVWYKEARLRLDTAFDALIYHPYHDLMGRVMVWYQDATGIRLTMDRLLNSEFSIEPPAEIQIAVRALNAVQAKRALLANMAETIH